MQGYLVDGHLTLDSTAPVQTACGRILGHTPEKLLDEELVECGSCRRTKAFRETLQIHALSDEKPDGGGEPPTEEPAGGGGEPPTEESAGGGSEPPTEESAGGGGEPPTEEPDDGDGEPPTEEPDDGDGEPPTEEPDIAAPAAPVVPAVPLRHESSAPNNVLDGLIWRRKRTAQP